MLENAEIMISRAPLQQREKVVLTPDENRASTDVEDSKDESKDDGPQWVGIVTGACKNLRVF